MIQTKLISIMKKEQSSKPFIDSETTNYPLEPVIINFGSNIKNSKNKIKNKFLFKRSSDEIFEAKNSSFKHQNPKYLLLGNLENMFKKYSKQSKCQEKQTCNILSKIMKFFIKIWSNTINVWDIDVKRLFNQVNSDLISKSELLKIIKSFEEQNKNENIFKSEKIRDFMIDPINYIQKNQFLSCLLYTSPSPRDLSTSRMPSSA